MSWPTKVADYFRKRRALRVSLEPLLFLNGKVVSHALEESRQRQGRGRAAPPRSKGTNRALRVQAVGDSEAVITSWESEDRFGVRRWLAVLVFLSWMPDAGLIRGADVLPSYFHTDFEADSGWHEGPWAGSETALRLTQGTAAIVLEDAPFGQVAELPASEPGAILSIETIPVQRAAKWPA